MVRKTLAIMLTISMAIPQTVTASQNGIINYSINEEQQDLAEELDEVSDESISDEPVAEDDGLSEEVLEDGHFEVMSDDVVEVSPDDEINADTTDEYMFSGGSGTEADPYKIASVYDLIDMAEFDYAYKTVYFKQTADIFVNSDIENPAHILKPCPGSASVYYDGNNCRIINLYIEGKNELIQTLGGSQTLGLAFIQRANTIKNLTISGARIYCPELASEETATSRTMYMSAIAGTVTHMDNCYLRGNIEFRNECTYFLNPQIAGMVNKVGEITNSQINANISSDIAKVGGDTVFAGMAYSIMQMNGCSVSGNIIAKADKVAGLAAFDNYSVSSISGKLISNCTAKQGAFITNAYESGEAYGIVSSVSNEINGCKNYATLSAAVRVAGIAGGCHTMTSCINYGQLVEAMHRYGLVGSVNVDKNETTTVSYCKNMADIDAHDMNSSYVSGIAGAFSNFKCQGNISFYKNSNEGDLSGHTVSGIVNNAGIGGLMISECYNFGDITGYNASGIADTVGEFRRSTDDDADICNIKDCGNEGNIVSEYNAAGIAIDANSSLIEDCYNSGDISSETFAAGIIQNIISGEKSSITTVSGCNNTGSISGKEIGGIIGSADYCAVEKCFNTGELTFSGKEDSDTAEMGGIVEHIVIGTYYADSADRSVTVEDCYNAGTVNWTKAKNNVHIGGVVGTANPGNGSITVRYCYNVGSLIGTVSPNNDYVGAIVGDAPNKGSMTIADNYYLESGFPGYSGYGSSGRGYVTTACTATQMKNSSTFTGWDFMSTWTMGSGQYLYPVLQNVAGAVYTITLKGNGGLFGEETEITRTTSGSGRLATIPRPKQAGKRFAGYYTSATGGERITKDYMFAGDSIIYAHWGDYDEEHRVTITPITPANGARSVKYFDRGTVSLSISFETSSPIDSFDLDSGSFKLVDVATGEAIYTAKSVRNFKKTNTATGTRIDYIFRDSGLEQGSEYYIEIEDGFITFEDDELFAYVEQGDWKFKTYYKPVSANIELPGFGFKNVEYSADMFLNPSTDYSSELSMLSVCLSNMVYEGKGRDENEEHRRIARQFMNLGFNAVVDADRFVSDHYFRDPDGENEDEKDRGNYSPSWIVHKNVSLNGENYDLIWIVVRGTYKMEWVDNFDPGTGQTHIGFERAADFVLDRYNDYVSNGDNNIGSKRKILVTGHSRGAAVANLIGKKLDDLQGNKDVYVYTYATPNVTRDGNIKNSLYDNIFNIINPEDFVTKVLPRKWGYGRYGRNYILPSRTFYGKGFDDYPTYDSFVKAVQNRTMTYISDLSGDREFRKYNPYDWGMSSIEAYFDGVTSMVQSIDGYYMTSLAFLNNLKKHSKKSGLDYMYKSLFSLYTYSLAYYMCGGSYEKEGLDNLVWASFKWGSNIGFSTETFFAWNGKVKPQFGCAHTAETYMAMLDLVSVSTLKKDKFYNGVKVNCPVDVTVKDSNGNVVGLITDNKVEKTNDVLAMDVTGDSKSFLLPKDIDYTIELTGNDTGTMDYSIVEYDADTGEIGRTVYQGIPLSDGKKYTQDLQGHEDAADAPVKDENSAVIEKTLVLNENDLGKLSVSVNVVGYGYASGYGSVTPGDYVVLSAQTNGCNEFLGWYDSESNLVSTDSEYGFSVRKSEVFTAKFTQNDEGLWTDPVPDQYYTGGLIKPEVNVYDGFGSLILNAEYTVSYKNNKKVYTLAEGDSGFDPKKAPSITITGKGNYDSKEVVYFRILPQNIAGDDFGTDDMALSVAKNSQKVSPILYWNGGTLKNGTDYKVDVYKADDIERKNSIGTSVKDAGDYIVKITGINNFTGTREVNLKVNGTLKPVSKLSVGKISNVKYTGSAITPNPVVKDGSKLLVKDTHYTLSYIGNLNVGTGYILIKGNPDAGYSGTRRVSFKIMGTPLSKAVVEGLPKSVSYTGNEITFGTDVLKLYLKAGNKTPRIDLVRDKDYEVSYTNNIRTGKATVIFTGMGGYTGTVKKNVNITPYDITSVSDTTEKFTVNCPPSVAYSKGGARPELNITFKNADGNIQTLVPGTDYTLSYKYNNEVNGTKKPLVTVKGKGNFKGSRSVEFTITAKDLNQVILDAADVVYKDKANIFTTKVSIIDTDGKRLKAGTDYAKLLKYSYLDATEVKVNGSAEMRAAGSEVGKDDIIPVNTVIKVTADAINGGNYSGNVSGTYRITKASIASANVTGIQVQEYTGKEIKPDPATITVKVGNAILKLYDEKTGEGDFIIKGYKNNIKKGTAKMILQGIGNYGGTKTVSFKIKAKRFMWWWRKL